VSNTARIFLALILGITLGAVLRGSSWGAPVAAFVEPIGILWLNALRMTIIPLVLALLITSVATTADAARGDQLTLRALAWFAGLLMIGVVFAALCSEAILTLWPVSAEAASALRASVPASATPQVPNFATALTGILPDNVFAALTAGEMLPIVIFALIFGFAATHINSDARVALLAPIKALGDVMMVIVGWVLILAPLGVAALAYGVGYHTGFSAASAIVQYIVTVSGVLILQLLFLTYPLALLLSGIAPVKLLRAFLPAQVLAATTQSSLASLPAMIASLRGTLDLPERTTHLVLPLAVALFRITSPAGNLAVGLFLAHLYGVHLSWGQVAIGATIAVIGSLSVVGIASSVTFFIVLVPMCSAMQVPIALLPLLLPVEVFPDIWRTVGNVTADMAVTTLLARQKSLPPSGTSRSGANNTTAPA